MCFCKYHHLEIHKIEKDLGCTTEVATRKLLSKKLKKEKNIKSIKYKNNKRVRKLKFKREINQVFEIRHSLFLKGIKVDTKNINTLIKLKQKYL